VLVVTSVVFFEDTRLVAMVGRELGDIIVVIVPAAGVNEATTLSSLLSWSSMFDQD